jgi:SAM-dependent methyltransferase
VIPSASVGPGSGQDPGPTGSRRYALLIAAASNRVYAGSALELTRAELTVFGHTGLSRPPTELAEATLGGVRYLTFQAALTGTDLAQLANLSSAYALFELVDDELLRPVGLHPLAVYDDDLITIPKYPGKTNEQFTRLLLNLTVLAARGSLLEPVTVLDPLCGRGTTLSQALRYGYHGIGIELDGKDVDAYAAFLRTWLQRKRIKHRTELHPVRRDRRQVARRFQARIGDQDLVVYHADTVQARQFLGTGCADAIVVDAPYGVAHGARTSGVLARSPLALLRAAVPVWAQLVRPGGAIGMSWNTHVASRADAVEVLQDAGFSVLTGPGYLDLAHRVDQAIIRDVVVARR